MGIFDDLPGFFFAGDKTDPRANTELRQRLALQMMMQGKNKGYPKNVGEGLTAIGDSLGEIGMARRLEAADLAQQQGAPGIVRGAPANPTAPPLQPRALYTPPPEQDEPPIQPAVAATPLPAATTAAPPPVLPPPVTAPPPTLPPPSTAPTTFDDRFNASRPRSVAPAGAPRAALDPRSRMAAILQARGGPTPNPTLAAANVPQDGGPPSDRTMMMSTNPGASGITVAPQPPPVRPEPMRVAQAANPYDMTEPTPPPRVQMSAEEVRLRNVAREYSGNRYVLQQLADPLAQLEAARTAEDARRVEEYKAKLQLHNQLKVKGLDYRANTPQRELELEKARQEVRKGQEPTLREDVETKLIYNPETGAYEQPRIAGADPDKKPAFKGTEFQGKALVNYGRARIAHEGLRAGGDEVLSDSPLQSAISSIPFGVGRSVRSDAYKEAETHAENFVQAFIRQQSGGAYGREELEAEARAMLPRYGDTAKQLETKREQREQFLSGLYGVIGPSGQKGVEIDAAKREAERSAHSAKDTKPDPLEGREAVFPDKSIRVRRNGQWVPK